MDAWDVAKLQKVVGRGLRYAAAGLLCSLASAWVGAIYEPFHDNELRLAADYAVCVTGDHSLIVTPPRSWQRSSIHEQWTVDPRMQPLVDGDWVIVDPPSWVERPTTNAARRTTAYGWPMASLRCSGDAASLFVPTTASDGIEIDLTSRRRITLPLTPMWLGIAINAAFYAVAAWAVVHSVRGVTRRARARRGGCPNCGYSRAGLPIASSCPECGKQH